MAQQLLVVRYTICVSLASELHQTETNLFWFFNILTGCERVKFVFSPDAHHGSYHLAEGGVRVDCVQREFVSSL